MSVLKQSAQAVQDALESSGLECRVTELPASTRTAKEAAQAIGCTVAQIAKTIVFKTSETGRAVLVVASGVNRVNEYAIVSSVGEPIEKASPDFVREATGFAIGGVPPCGHLRPLLTFIDRDLLGLDVLWAAAGTPNAVFRIEPEDLIRLTEGQVLDITCLDGSTS
jgi:prolyl-tRNA editing enzyme YbaK/EbsC (Cys-tRNA(Pro) deacylase)